MTFGANYRPMERKPFAEEGTHNVTLTDVTEHMTPEHHWLDFKIRYEGGVEKTPDSFRIYEPKPNASQKEKDWFNILLTDILSCFDLQPDFSKEGLTKMRGRTGMIEVVRDEKGYLNVKNFLKKDKVTMGEDVPALIF